MFETHHDSREGHIIHSTLAVEDAQAIRADQFNCALKVTVGDVDLPAFVSNGKLYIQAPLPLVFEAFAESLPDFISDLEIRVSDSRGRALSLDSDGRPVHRPRLAQSRMVRRGRKS